jgi:hypothetical protein
LGDEYEDEFGNYVNYVEGVVSWRSGNLWYTFYWYCVYWVCCGVFLNCHKLTIFKWVIRLNNLVLSPFFYIFAKVSDIKQQW